MKSLSFVLAFCLFTLVASAQQVHFSDTSNKWKTFWWDGGNDKPGGFTQFSYYGFRTFHGITYDTLDHALIREDSAAKKVYCLARGIIGGPEDTSESLLYDFNLGMGDTLRTRFAKHYVAAIDSVQLDGISHKVWTLHGFWKDIVNVPGMILCDYKVLEGVGCLADPTFPYYPFSFESWIIVVCFQNNGSHPVLSHPLNSYFNNSTSCTASFGVGVHDVHTGGQSVSVIPNPVTDMSALIFAYKIADGSVIVTDVTGRSLVRSALHDASELLLGDKIALPGVYFYRVSDAQSGATFTGTFVKE